MHGTVSQPSPLADPALPPQSANYDLLTGGGLARLVREDGVRGVTSNPSIFKAAITGSSSYDAEIDSVLAADPQHVEARFNLGLTLESMKRKAEAIPEYERAQVSINLVNTAVTKPHEAFEACRASARDRGVRVTGSELVGLIPEGEIEDMKAAFQAHLNGEFEAGKEYKPNKADWLDGKWSGLKRAEGEDDPRRGSTGIPIEELKDIRDNGPFPVEINCHYCNTPYRFEEEDIRQIYGKRYPNN